jgi:hypothetical protein
MCAPAAGGIVAVERAVYNAVVVDYRMPEPDGFEASKEWRRS